MPANPYTGSYVGSFFAELSPEEKAMLNPMYQNIGQQQGFQTQQMQQGNALTQAAGQTAKGGGSMNPAALAAMLRKKDPYEQAQAAMDKYGAENVYGFGGQGQVPVWNGEM